MNDNHANEGFHHEGDELRAWLKATVPDSFFVICGDRHWQYHSVHPETGVHEFCPGAASDAHAGGSPGKDPAYHRLHLQKGGVLPSALVRDGKFAVYPELLENAGYFVRPLQFSAAVDIAPVRFYLH